MNTWLAIAAIALTCVFFVWILTRQSAQQRDGTLHHPEDERLREEADTRDAATSTPGIPWRDGRPPPEESPPAVAAPDAITSTPDLPEAPEGEAEQAAAQAGESAGDRAATEARAGTATASGAGAGPRAGEQGPDGTAPGSRPAETRSGSHRADPSRTGA